MHLIAIPGISASILNDIEFLRNLLRRKQDKNVGFLKLFAEENSENEAVAKEFYEALIAYSILYIQNLTGKMDGLFETEIKDGKNRKTEIQREKIQGDEIQDQLLQIEEKSERDKRSQNKLKEIREAVAEVKSMLLQENIVFSNVMLRKNIVFSKIMIGAWVKKSLETRAKKREAEDKARVVGSVASSSDRETMAVCAVLLCFFLLALCIGLPVYFFVVGSVAAGAGILAGMVGLVAVGFLIYGICKWSESRNEKVRFKQEERAVNKSLNDALTHVQEFSQLQYEHDAVVMNKLTLLLEGIQKKKLNRENELNACQINKREKERQLQTRDNSLSMNRQKMETCVEKWGALKTRMEEIKKNKMVSQELSFRVDVARLEKIYNELNEIIKMLSPDRKGILPLESSNISSEASSSDSHLNATVQEAQEEIKKNLTAQEVQEEMNKIEKDLKTFLESLKTEIKEKNELSSSIQLAPDELLKCSEKSERLQVRADSAIQKFSFFFPLPVAGPSDNVGVSPVAALQKS